MRERMGHLAVSRQKCCCWQSCGWESESGTADSLRKNREEIKGRTICQGNRKQPDQTVRRDSRRGSLCGTYL